VAEDHDLEVLVDIAFPTKHKEFDETLEYCIRKESTMGADSPNRDGSSTTRPAQPSGIGFLYPTRS